MKGDKIIVEEHHKLVAYQIIIKLLSEIQTSKRKYILSVSGESGSGKSETAVAIKEELEINNINAIILGQDDYFFLPPKSNAKKRKENSNWLGPHVEVNFELLESHIQMALNNKSKFEKPLVDYDKDIIQTETISLENIDVIIIEGTYTALLRQIDKRIFIAKNKIDTYQHRLKRNRGNEVNDKFLEDLLETEHKIIAGHKYLADFIITKENHIVYK